MQSFESMVSTWAMPLGLGFFAGLGGLAFFLIIAWSIVWKGMALWKSARKGSKVWFVVLLLVNTVGILDILYLYVFSKKSEPVEG
jgi:methionyl-tRNA synthetase